VIGDAKNWPAMNGRSLAGYQQKKVWMSDGAGRFLDVAPMVGVTDRYDGRSIAMADLSNRGVLDAIVANQRGPLLLYRNEVAPGRGWIGFELEGSCTSDISSAPCTNRGAIGAQVTAFWQGKQQVQEVSGGSGFCAQNQRRLHFGLGSVTAIDKAVVRWPSGKVQELTGLQANRVHKIKEPA
jgi:enediyne biosynthesis protein E4